MSHASRSSSRSLALRTGARVARRRTVATVIATGGVALTAALVAGATLALWNGNAPANAGVVTAGTISAAETVTPSTFTFRGSTNTTTGSVLVRNSGTVPSPFTTSVSLGAGSSQALAKAITVTVWPAGDVSACTPSATVPSGAYSGTWSSIASAIPTPLTGTIAAGSSQTYCVRSSMNVTSVPSGIASGNSVTPVFATKLTLGGWSSTATASATQTFIDDLAPAAPASFTVTYSPAGAVASTSSPTLTWTPSTDNVAVAGYDIYRSAGTTAPSTTGKPYAMSSSATFTDGAVTAGTTYTYVVVARDAAGNKTASTAFIVDRKPPTTPALTAASSSATSVSLSWTASTDDVTVAGYDLYRDGVFWKTITGTSTTDTTVDPGSTHTYAVRARDAAGNTSPLSAGSSATTPPVTSTSWYQVKSVASGQCIEASGWGTASGTYLTHQNCNSPAAGNQTWGFNTSDSSYYTVSPGYPAGALIWDVNGAGTTSGTQVFLWPRKTSGIENQQWSFRSAGTGRFQIVSRNSGMCLDAGGYATGTASGSNTMRQMPCNINDANQLFTFTASASGSTGMPPTAPADLTASGTTSTSTNLTWTAATDDAGVTGYKVYRNGTYVKTVTGTSTSDSGLAPSTSYTYSVTAVDAAGNESPRSPSVTVSTAAAPVTPLLQCTQSSDVIAVSWTGPQPEPPVYYDVVLNGVVLGQTNSYTKSYWIGPSQMQAAGVTGVRSGIPVVVRYHGNPTALFQRTVSFVNSPYNDGQLWVQCGG